MGQCSRNWNRSNRRCPTCKVLGPGRRASSSCGLEPTDRFDGILRRCGGRITWRPPRRQQPRLRNDIVNICEDRAVRALLRNDISGRRKLAGVVIHSEVGGRGEGPGGPPPRFSRRNLGPGICNDRKVQGRNRRVHAQHEEPDGPDSAADQDGHGAGELTSDSSLVSGSPLSPHITPGSRGT